jgi:thioredoxin-like negative regulator of GroEL
MPIPGLGVALALLLGPGGDAPLVAARAQLDAGRPADALKTYKDVNAAQDGRCVECVVGMASAQLALGRNEEAAQTCTKALKLGVADARQRAQLLSLQSVALTRQGKPATLSGAESALRSALEADPTFAEARFNLGYVLLKLARDAEAIEQLRLFLDVVPDGQAADLARQYIEQPRRARERFAPDFSAELLDGSRVSLASVHGRVALLDFWATWCGPCRDAIPELKSLAKKYPEGQLVILSVNVDDDAEKWRRFVRQNGMTWTQCRDGQGSVREAFGVRGFPTYVVIDGEGVIRGELTGTDPFRSVGYRLRETLQSLPELRSR